MEGKAKGKKNLAISFAQDFMAETPKNGEFFNA